MNVGALARKVFAVLAEYERRQDFDAAAFLPDRVRALERDVAALRQRRPNGAAAAAGERAGPVS